MIVRVRLRQPATRPAPVTECHPLSDRACRPAEGSACGRAAPRRGRREGCASLVRFSPSSPPRCATPGMAGPLAAVPAASGCPMAGPRADRWVLRAGCQAGAQAAQVAHVGGRPRPVAVVRREMPATACHWAVGCCPGCCGWGGRSCPGHGSCSQRRAERAP